MLGFAAWTFSWLSGAAPAQEGGPLIVGESEKLEFFRIEDLRLALDFYGQYQIEEIQQPGSPDTRDTELLLREELELITSGFFGHPNLAHLDLDLRFRLSQEELDSDTLSRNERTLETVLDYDASLQILRETRAPLTIYSRQNQTFFDRQFGTTLDNTLTEHGARLALRSAAAPMQLQVFRREQEQSGRFGAVDFELKQNTIDAHGQLHPGGGHNLWWDYTFDNVDESGQLRLTNSFDRHDAFIAHELDFGPTEQHNLRSTLRYFKETGKFPVEILQIDETLRLRHDRKLESRYDYNFDRQSRIGSTQTLHRGTAQVRHELFDSLVTIAEAGASVLHVSNGDFQSEQQFGNVELEYRKRVPYGRVHATADVQVSRQDDSDRGTTVQIINESHTFDASGIVVLNRRNIITSSIFITDVAGIIIYAEGADYTILALADRVEIRRVLGGNIAAGQTVLIDFQVAPEPANTTDTLGLGATVRYTIEEGPLTGLSLYTRYFDQNQDRSPINPVLLPETDIQEFVYGLEYDVWKLSLLAEQQIRKSSLSPFEAIRLEARYVERFGPGSALILNANFNQIDRTDEGTRTDITTLAARWNQQLTKRLHADLELTWRDEQDSASFDSQGFDQELDLTWRYRQTSVYATVRNTFVNSDVTDTSLQTFILGVRREF